MNKDLKILEELRLMAEDVEPVKHAKLAAALAIRGRIVSFGINKWITHPFQQRYGKNEFSPYWHAETNAVFNALKRIDVNDLHKTSLYVVRVKRPSERSKDWVLGLARPCRGCRKCIYEFGIKTVFYSTDENSYVID